MNCTHFLRRARYFQHHNLIFIQEIMVARAVHPRKKTSRTASPKRWSDRVTKQSNALDLQSRIFKSTSSLTIAHSLKRSAERSRRRKGTPYQSAMSMLNFYINRAGKNLPAQQKKILEGAKAKLRELFKRTAEIRKKTTT